MGNETHEILNPFSGEPVDGNDVDGLIDLLEEIREQEDRLHAARSAIVAALANKAPQTGDSKTSHLRGLRRCVRIEYPDAWSQRILRQVWEQFPERCQEFMRIASFGVRLRAYAELQTESGPDSFQRMRELLLSANRGPVPRVTIEPDQPAEGPEQQPLVGILQKSIAIEQGKAAKSTPTRRKR
jgi:hypothetical protein